MVSPQGNNGEFPRERIVESSRSGQIELQLVLGYLFSLVIVLAVICAPFVLAHKLLDRDHTGRRYHVGAILAIVVAAVIARQFYAQPLPPGGSDGLLPIGVAVYQACVFGGMALAIEVADRAKVWLG